MATVLCSACTNPTVLPEDWPRSVYVCPHCGHRVALARGAAAAAPAPLAEPSVQVAPPQPSAGVWAGWLVVVVLSVTAGLVSTRGELFDLLRPYLAPAVASDSSSPPVKSAR